MGHCTSTCPVDNTPTLLAANRTSYPASSSSITVGESHFLKALLALRPAKCEAEARLHGSASMVFVMGVK